MDGPWITYAGFRFRTTGNGTFQFISRSNPQHWYSLDINEAPYCDCHPARTNPPCCHLITLRLYLKKLRNVKHL